MFGLQNVAGEFPILNDSKLCSRSQIVGRGCFFEKEGAGTLL
jgi:hypothetical protein